MTSRAPMSLEEVLEVDGEAREHAAQLLEHA